MLFKNGTASISKISPCPSLISRFSMFFLMKLQNLAFRSTKVETIAPREIASKPTVPEPAHKSRNLPARILRNKILNIDSRIRLTVGFAFKESGPSRYLPRCLPSVICLSETIFGKCSFFQGGFPFPLLSYPCFAAYEGTKTGLHVPRVV